MAAKVITNTRWQRTPIRGEADWIPASLDDLELIRQALVDAGEPITVVNGITAWLVAKALGEDDPSSAHTRAKYRKVLEAAGPSPIMHGSRVLSGRERRRLAAAVA